MIDIVRESMLSVLAINGEADDAVYAPSLEELTQRLEKVRLGIVRNQCVECVVRLMGNIEGELAFIRVNHPQNGSFAGWVVQLSGCSEDYNSFALARLDDWVPSRFESVCVIELFSCVDAFDSRCVLSHGDLLEWITHELSGNIATDRYRWIDFSIALKELF